jgi:hypothetical protein
VNWLRQRWTALRQTWREGWEAEKAGLRRDWGSLRERLRTLFGRARYRVTKNQTHVVTTGVVEGATDKRRAVVFGGHQLAQRIWAEGDRRVTETLYLVDFERYLVHTRTLRRARGLPTELELREVGEADLARGKYAELGRLRPLGWREALS